MEPLPLLRPPRLRPGDAVGLVAPSGPVPVKERLERAVAQLRAWGYEPVVGPVALSGAADAPAADRAAELHAMVADPAVTCIVAAIGGYSANAVLPHLDPVLWREHPTALVGYSDVTALLLGVLATAGVVTFHGPTALPELGEFPGALPYTTAGWRAALTADAGPPAPLGVLAPAPDWTEEFLAWGGDDVRPRALQPSPGWAVLAPGQARGPLLGGNIETLSVLVGTPYLPSFEGAVLLCETTATSVSAFAQKWQHLESAGVLSGVRGVLLGRTFRAGAAVESGVREVVRRAARDLGVPAVAGLDVGHPDPMLTLPLGCEVDLSTLAGARVEVLEPGIR
ncbi:MAG: S66 peptidase family protein [Kineosporiaceae bacterium]